MKNRCRKYYRLPFLVERKYEFAEEKDPWVSLREWKDKRENAISLVAEENEACSSKRVGDHKSESQNNSSNSSWIVSPSRSTIFSEMLPNFNSDEGENSSDSEIIRKPLLQKFQSNVEGSKDNKIQNRANIIAFEDSVTNKIKISEPTKLEPPLTVSFHKQSLSKSDAECSHSDLSENSSDNDVFRNAEISKSKTFFVDKNTNAKSASLPAVQKNKNNYISIKRLVEYSDTESSSDGDIFKDSALKTVERIENKVVNELKDTKSNKDQDRTKNKVLDQINVKLKSGCSSHGIEVSRRQNSRWDKKDQCPYCNTDVTNFSRHLYRKHSKEESVKNILHSPKGNEQRKVMIDLLRKQGNFSLYSKNIIRPVQRPTLSDTEKQLIFLPCKFCKGLYKKPSLKRHVTKCVFNTKKDDSNHKYASEGQTMLAFSESRISILNRLRLQAEVFNTMRADRVSLTGKSDPLVCQYAEDYLKKHKRPHIKNVVSNKIRELRRLLITLQDNYNINSMLETLNPEHFDKVVSSVRIISGYTASSKEFQAPSLALHFRTILLTVCATAVTLLLKKDPVLPVDNYDEVLKRIKNFRKLVSSNWKFEMGSLALKDLTEKNSLNPQKLPVTNDVIKFNSYCHEVAKKAALDIENKLQNIEAFKTLSETVLALTISLNRKRIGDVQYVKTDSYTLTTNTREDSLSILTESEKQLAQYFKRIVSIGKGSKAIPILFPKQIQGYIDLMLKVRGNTNFVPSENPYLFALVGSSNRWIDGARILNKYAHSCGAQYPDTITSRLRKQIATVLQILSLNDIEMEQLATFMGHTKKTHEEFYRLPQDIFQTSKIAKLLLMLMNRGISKEDEGKTIREIDAEIWENDVKTDAPEQGSTSLATEDLAFPNTSSEGQIDEHVQVSTTSTEMRKISGDERTTTKTRGSWKSNQKKIMLKHFKHHIKNKMALKKEECLEFKKKHLDMF